MEATLAQTPRATLTGALSIGVAVGVYGISFGVLAVAGGLSAAQACVMSMLVFTGASQSDPEAARAAFLATGISVWVFWNLGTLGGALVGGGIGDPRRFGLDAMFPAAFLALLAPQLRRPGAPVTSVTGVVIALALVPFAPAGVPVIAALAGVVPGVLVARGART